MTETDSNNTTGNASHGVAVQRLVRRFTAWAWRTEIAKARDFDRVRDEQWRYRLALEEIAESHDSPFNDQLAREALNPPN